MGRSNTSVYGPANAPVRDEPGHRADRRRFLTFRELPPFAIAGPVNETGMSPWYPVAIAGTIRQLAVTIGFTDGGFATFEVRVDGGATTVGPFTVNDPGLTLIEVEIAVVVNGLLGIALTDTSGGDALQNLLIVPRYVPAGSGLL